jgi:AraC family ethanolamine operon transcriptional activator
LAFRPGSGERLRFHGRSVPPSAVLVAMGGSDFTLRTPDDFTIYGIVLEQEVLALRHQQLFGRDLPAHWLQTAACACPKPATGCCVARFPNCWRWRGKHRTALAANYCWIVRWMPCCWPCHRQAAEPLLRREGSSQRHWQWVEQARQRALQPASQWLTVEGLCRELHVTRRTCKTVFRKSPP